MDVQELTSCILQFSTATIFDEIKLQSSVLGQPGPNSPTQVSYIFDEGPIYQGHSTETWNLESCLGCGEVFMSATIIPYNSYGLAKNG